MTSKNKGGRPRKEISEEQYEQLKSMARIMCTQDEICSIIGMDAETLNRCLRERGYAGFSDFHKTHSHAGKMSLRRSQFKAALDGNPTMLIWMGKQQLGQRDKQDMVVTNRFESMTDDELDAFIDNGLAEPVEGEEG